MKRFHLHFDKKHFQNRSKNGIIGSVANSKVVNV